MDKTTIQLSKATKSDLDSLKDGDKESYEMILQRLIQHYSETAEDEDDVDGVDEAQAREIARELANEQIAERVIPEAQR